MPQEDDWHCAIRWQRRPRQVRGYGLDMGICIQEPPQLGTRLDIVGVGTLECRPPRSEMLPQRGINARTSVLKDVVMNKYCSVHSREGRGHASVAKPVRRLRTQTLAACKGPQRLRDQEAVSIPNVLSRRRYRIGHAARKQSPGTDPAVPPFEASALGAVERTPQWT